MYWYRRNADVDLRDIERDYLASPTQGTAGRLMAALARLGEAVPGQESLRYLILLDQWGPRLENEFWPELSSASSVGTTLRLTERQENRYQNLMWHQFMSRAQQADRTELLDFALLRDAEKFVDRNVHSRWLYNLFLDTTNPDGEVVPNPNEDKHNLYSDYRGMRGPIAWYPDDTATAKIYCLDHDEGIDLFNKDDYIEYWKDYPDREPWENNVYLVRGQNADYYENWDGTLEHLGYVGGGNLSAIGFMYHHRNCTSRPEEEEEIPYDTPSLPLRGTRDPHWRYRRNADEDLQSLSRQYYAHPTDDSLKRLNAARKRIGVEILPECAYCGGIPTQHCEKCSESYCSKPECFHKPKCPYKCDYCNEIREDHCPFCDVSWCWEHRFEHNCPHEMNYEDLI